MSELVVVSTQPNPSDKICVKMGSSSPKYGVFIKENMKPPPQGIIIMVFVRFKWSLFLLFPRSNPEGPMIFMEVENDPWVEAHLL